MTEYITKRDAELVLRQFKKGFRRTDEICAVNGCILEIQDMDSVDAVEVARIKETKQYVLQVLDTLIETDKPLYEMTSDNSYYGGKLAAFEIARRLVNAALTDLCRED